MPPTRRPLREAHEVQGPQGEPEQAWWEDDQGNRTRMPVEDYNAGIFPAGMKHAARAKRWDTPSGYVEDDTVHVLANGDRYVCLRAQRHMGEIDDLLPVPANWRAGTHALRPGVRIVNGEVQHDDELPRPAMPRGR